MGRGETMFNNLEDIIEKSSLGYEDKQLFKDIFGALYEEQEKMYKAISEKVEKENRFALRETKDKRSGEWEISTILTEKDTELKDSNRITALENWAASREGAAKNSFVQVSKVKH